MRTVMRLLITVLKLAILSMLGGLAIILRYLWHTPQPLHTTMIGDPRLYKWAHGHIFYKVAGPADGPPLVLFHAPGVGASSYEMRPLAEMLAQRYRVYVPDLPGFGLSDRPDLEYNAALYIQFCQDFLADVIAQPTIVVGSGLSCNYSLALAARRTDLCQQVILLSPIPLFTERQLPKWLAPLLLNPFTGLFFYSLLTTPVILQKIVARQYTSNSRQVSEAELAATFANAHQFGAEHAALAWLAGRLDLDASPQLKQVTQPVLTIWEQQAHKAIAPLQKQSSLLTARAIILDGAGQRIHERRPEQVTTSMLAWLREFEAPAETQAITIPDKVEANARVGGEEMVASTRSVEAPITTEAPAEAVQATSAANEPTQTENETTQPAESVVEAGSIEAYCVKCRHKRSMLDAKKIVTKKGRSAMSGVCPVCGTQLFRFISNGKEA